MNRGLRSSLASLGLALLCLSCGGGDGGGGGPTAPPAPSGRTVQVTMSVGAYNFSRTIQEARLLWDDYEIARYSGTATNQIYWLLTPMEHISVGSHTVSLVIDRQTRSPVPYRLDGALASTAPGSTPEVIPLFVSSTQLRTGQPYVFRVEIE